MKKLTITPSEKSKNHNATVQHLYAFLRKEYSTSSDTSIELEDVGIGTGEMGGWYDGVVAIITAASEPITKLVESLHKYIDSFNTTLEIKVGSDTIRINTSTPDKTKELLAASLNLLKDFKNEEE